MKKRLLSLALALCMALTLFPAAALAEDVGAETPAFTVNSTTKTVYFGGYEWYVIGYNGTGVQSTANDGTVTLLAKEQTDAWNTTVQYNSSNTAKYEGGELHTVMRNVYDTFSPDEKALIAPVTLDTLWDGTDPFKTDGTLADQHVWPLSFSEWQTINNGTIRSYGSIWWLRSPDDGINAYVGDYGGGHYYVILAPTLWAIRPALKLNLESVIFTSDASGASAKSSATAGSGNLVGALAPTGAVKLTVVDDGQTLDVYGLNSGSGTSALTFTYDEDTAITGTNQYVSCVLEDVSGDVKYYGKLENLGTSASGTVSVPLTGVVNGTYTLKIFAEQANGDRLTDFASQPFEIEIAVDGGCGTPTDNTAPTITVGTVSRTGNTAATVKFTSDEAGRYYYEVVADGAGDPGIVTTGTGTACGTSEVTITNPTGLTAGAKDIWIYVKDAIGNIGKLKIDIPAYVPPSTDATLKTVAGQTITTGSEAGTDTAPKTASFSVANSVTSLTAANVVANDENATVKFGKDISTLGTDDLPLSVGSNTVYVEVTAEDTTTKLYYKLTISRARAQSNNSGGGSTATAPSKTADIGGVDVNYTISASGVVTLKPTPAQLEKLLAAIGTDGVLNIAVSGIDGMKSAMIEIDLTKLIAHDKLQIFEFSVLDMKLSFPVGALESMRKLAKTLRFGLRPGSVIFELTDANGKEINWSDYANPVTVSMAYTSPMDISTHQIVMVDEYGEIIPRSWYTWFKGTPVGLMSAKVHKAGIYDAEVSEIGSFADTKGLWMDEAVGYMAARGIVEGVGDNLFDRSGTITRAHFVTMLMRALDVEIDASTLEAPYADFADIPEWAQPHVITAKALGITLADEDNSFNPNDAITRQEMFFMAYEAMDACGMLPEMFTEQWIIFSDWEGENGVKTEYSDAIQNLAKLGLVKGNGDGTLNPSGTSTRAEGAQFLYNILKYDAK